MLAAAPAVFNGGPAVPGGRQCAEVGAMQGINSWARGPGGSRQCQWCQWVPVETEGRRHSSVAGRELAGDEGMLASSNK